MKSPRPRTGRSFKPFRGATSRQSRTHSTARSCVRPVRGVPVPDGPVCGAGRRNRIGYSRATVSAIKLSVAGSDSR